MLFTEKMPFKVDGFHASKITEGIERKARKEMEKGVKYGQEINEQDLARRVHHRESLFYKMLVDVLGTRGNGPKKLPRKSATLKYDKASDYVIDKDYVNCD